MSALDGAGLRVGLGRGRQLDRAEADEIVGPAAATLVGARKSVEFDDVLSCHRCLGHLSNSFDLKQ